MQSSPTAPSMPLPPPLRPIHEFDPSHQRSVENDVAVQAYEIATKLIIGQTDNTPVSDQSAIAAWLGQQNDPLASAALAQLMGMMDLESCSLVAAVRVLASRIYLSAETQVLDRILEQLAQQFVHGCCTSLHRRRVSLTSHTAPRSQRTSSPHRKSLSIRHSSNFSFSSPSSPSHYPFLVHDQCYSVHLDHLFWRSVANAHASPTYPRAHAIAHTIAFSLLMLNTDLHAAGSTSRMTKRQFVFNTLQCLDPYQLLDKELDYLHKMLREYYYDIKHHPIQPPLFIQSRVTQSPPSLSPATSTVSTRPSSLMGTLSSAASLNTKSSNSFHFSSPFNRPSPPTSSSSLSSFMPSWRPWSITSASSSVHNSFDRGSTINRSTSASSGIYAHSPDKSPSSPNTLIHTAVMYRKHLLQTAGERGKDRSWKRFTLNLSLTKLYVIPLSGPSSQSPMDQKKSPSTPESSHGDDRSGLGVENVHCVASLFTGLPKLNYTTSRSFVWMLVRSDGVTDLLQANSAAERDMWIDSMNACNARWSRGPSTLEPGGVGSSKYGWESDALDTIATKGMACIAGWKAPPNNPYISNKNEPDQLKHCQTVLSKYETLLANHIDARDGVDKAIAGLAHHQGTSESKRNAEQTLKTNWHRRLEYLNGEVSKWRIYGNALASRPVPLTVNTQIASPMFKLQQSPLSGSDTLAVAYPGGGAPIQVQGGCSSPRSAQSESFEKQVWGLLTELKLGPISPRNYPM